jgi:hypothetical protein
MSRETQEQVRRLLSRELRLAARYRYFVSIVLATSDRKGISLTQFLRDSLRECDDVFEFDDAVAVLLPHTTGDEAQVAVGRCQCRCNGEVDLRFGVVVYPGDAATANDLLATAHGRLADARDTGFGAVIGPGRALSLAGVVDSRIDAKELRAEALWNAGTQSAPTTTTKGETT